MTIDDVDVAFPLTVLQEEGAINYSVGERRIAVFHSSGTASALDGGVHRRIARCGCGRRIQC